MNKFYSYKGSIIEFCQANNIKQNQLYQRRKKLVSKTNPEFHDITLNKEADAVAIFITCGGGSNCQGQALAITEMKIQISKDGDKVFLDI